VAAVPTGPQLNPALTAADDLDSIFGPSTGESADVPLVQRQWIRAKTWGTGMASLGLVEYRARRPGEIG